MKLPYYTWLNAEGFCSYSMCVIRCLTIYQLCRTNERSQVRSWVYSRSGVVSRKELRRKNALFDVFFSFFLYCTPTGLMPRRLKNPRWMSANQRKIMVSAPCCCCNTSFAFFRRLVGNLKNKMRPDSTCSYAVRTQVFLNSVTRRRRGE